MISQTVVSLALTGLFPSVALNASQCTLTPYERELVIRAVINSRIWSPGLEFTMTAERSYVIRWVRLGSTLLASRSVPVPSDVDLSGVDIPVYELGKDLPGLIAVRRVAWSEGRPDFLLGYARRLANDRKVIIEGPCTSLVPETALQENQPLPQTARIEILKEVVPHLLRLLKSSFANGGSCRGDFIPPRTHETRAVGLLKCTGEGVSEDFYYWVFLSPSWDVLAVYVGFDPPGHKTGQYAYNAVRHRGKLPVSLKFP
jgi:hypothetical protein